LGISGAAAAAARERVIAKTTTKMNLEAMTTLMDTIEDKPVTDEEFESASTQAAALEGLSNELRLLFYGLYKQGTVGDINTTAPWAIEMVKRAKWYVLSVSVPVPVLVPAPVSALVAAWS
jgi:hypothetical protein